MDYAYMQKYFSLDGRKAVITGSSQGIGQAAAESLARFGAEVAILGRNQVYIDQTVESITLNGGTAKGYNVDVSKKNEIDDFFDNYLIENGKLDIFVNNAAYTIKKTIQDSTPEEIEGLYKTNFFSAFFCIQRAGKIMMEQKGGSIIIVSSVNAVRGLPSQGIYSTTKAALESLMHCTAADLVKHGVRVNSIIPGWIQTGMNGPVDTPEKQERLMKMVSSGRVGMPKEIGDVIACMCTDAFSYMIGSSIVVDGGLLLRVD